MTTVAVIADSGKSIGGGLTELRAAVEREGVTRALWHEVPKSKKAPKALRKALADGADLVFAWGGDGTVQRCIDVMVGSGAALAIVPAGTANLLATNLGIPSDIAEAVRIGLHGARRPIDVGVLNGEHFAVMAGAGFDARMIRDADGKLKKRLGRLAYVVTGAKNLRSPQVKGTVRIDGKPWFKGRLTMVLVGNVGSLFGGVKVFEAARPDDGRLDVGVVTAASMSEWARALARTAVGNAADSPFVEVTSAKKIDVKLAHPLPYELDGGARGSSNRLEVRIQPGAITMCVPEGGSA